jgi:hypothetical protein
MRVISEEQREQISSLLRAIFYAIPHTHLQLQDQVAEVRAEIEALPKLKERTIDINNLRLFGMSADQIQALKDWAEERGWGKCSGCKGAGFVYDGWEDSRTCRMCNGTGKGLDAV